MNAAIELQGAENKFGNIFSPNLTSKHYIGTKSKV